jgi:hypothetical protein
MVTVTVTLDDDVYGDLKRKADGIGQPVEALLAALAAREAVEGVGVTPEFIADVNAMIEEYRPVLRRLAE